MTFRRAAVALGLFLGLLAGSASAVDVLPVAQPEDQAWGVVTQEESGDAAFQEGAEEQDDNHRNRVLVLTFVTALGICAVAGFGYFLKRKLGGFDQPSDVPPASEHH